MAALCICVILIPFHPKKFPSPVGIVPALFTLPFQTTSRKCRGCRVVNHRVGHMSPAIITVTGMAEAVVAVGHQFQASAGAESKGDGSVFIVADLQ